MKSSDPQLDINGSQLFVGDIVYVATVDGELKKAKVKAFKKIGEYVFVVFEGLVLFRESKYCAKL